MSDLKFYSNIVTVRDGEKEQTKEIRFCIVDSKDTITMVVGNSSARLITQSIPGVQEIPFSG